MLDASAVITRAISEHHAIREHVKLAGDTVNDVEALLTLYRAQSVWSQTSISALNEKQNQLLQAISLLDQGLKNHFGFEEQAFPPLIGELLMRALLHEHHEISGQVESVKVTLANINLEGLEQQELFSQKSGVQEIVNHLGQAVEEHAHHEETILNMMKKALEKNKA